MASPVTTVVVFVYKIKYVRSSVRWYKILGRIYTIDHPGFARHDLSILLRVCSFLASHLASSAVDYACLETVDGIR